MLKRGARVSYYHTAGKGYYPTTKMSDGLRHLSGTLNDAVNLAFCLGWEEIVLVGVDLYDTRYFWLDPDKTFFTDYTTGKVSESLTSDRGQRYDGPHSTVQNGVVDEMANWANFLKERGVRLFTYNPKSLLSSKIPVHQKTGHYIERDIEMKREL